MIGPASEAVRLAAALFAVALTSHASVAARGNEAGLHVAAQTWGMPPCGQPRVETSTPAAYQAAHGTGYFDNGEPLAWADDTRCVIVVNPDLAGLSMHTAVKRCHVIVHEWGHLAGHEHSANPRSVMYASADAVSEGREFFGRHRWRWVAAGAFKPCYAAATP